MEARKHRCRILLGASEPVAYRLVYLIISFVTEVRCFLNPADPYKM